MVYCKSIKMMDKPSLENLTREHVLLSQNLEDVLGREGDLDLFVKLDG